jgi:LAO/AO transport system kinase
VLTCSAATGDGLDELWSQVQRHRAVMDMSGEFAARRVQQQIDWMWAAVHDRIVSSFDSRADVRSLSAALEGALRAGTITPTMAAQRLLDLTSP